MRRHRSTSPTPAPLGRVKGRAGDSAASAADRLAQMVIFIDVDNKREAIGVVGFLKSQILREDFDAQHTIRRHVEVGEIGAEVETLWV